MNEDKKVLSAVSLLIGIVSMLLSCIGGGVLGLVGIGIGIIAFIRKRNLFALSGLILSLLAFVINIIVFLTISIFFLFGVGFSSTKAMNAIGTYEGREDNIEKEFFDEKKIMSAGKGLNGIISQGNVVTLGAYEQDNDFDNGCESIEWIVVDVQGDKALLLSKYVLDNLPFDKESKEGVGWDTSSIREWLNVDFYHGAFGEEEQELIVSVSNYTERRLLVGSYEVETNDCVFLLSQKELSKYYENYRMNYTDRDWEVQFEGDVFGVGTEYSYSNNLDVNSNNGYSGWWLRCDSTENKEYDYKSVVSSDGAVDSRGFEPKQPFGIRPAIWINMN